MLDQTTACEGGCEICRVVTKWDRAQIELRIGRWLLRYDPANGGLSPALAPIWQPRHSPLPLPRRARARARVEAGNQANSAMENVNPFEAWMAILEK
jgi:hypothetical protein